MAGPIPLLGLLDELRDFANRRNMGQKMVGGGVRGAATRGLLGMDAPENATPIQREVYENAARMSAPAQGLTALKAATVFHGTPHKFTKFDAKKIGTGEGNQSFGHGLYVAQNPSVAKDYQFIDAKIDPNVVKYKGKSLESLYESAQKAQDRAYRMPNGPAKQKAIDSANAELGMWESMMTRNHPKKVIEQAIDPESGWDAQANFARSLDLSKFSGVDMNPGNLYKIDLPDEAIARMLDWEKPLNKQPQVVRDSLSKLGIAVDDRKLSEFDDALLGALAGTGSSSIPKQPMNQMGQEIYRSLGAPQVAAQRLREAGIPGIRYLDQGSRGQGQGTSNFVVFPGEEELLRILERNGVPIQSLLD
jgi:hypothetical protein